MADEKASKSSRSRRRGKGRNVDGGPSGNKMKLGSANFSEPVSFVSGGVQQSGKKKNDQTEENSGDDGEDGKIRSLNERSKKVYFR